MRAEPFKVFPKPPSQEHETFVREALRTQRVINRGLFNPSGTFEVIERGLTRNTGLPEEMWALNIVLLKPDPDLYRLQTVRNTGWLQVVEADKPENVVYTMVAGNVRFVANVAGFPVGEKSGCLLDTPFDLNRRAPDPFKYEDRQELEALLAAALDGQRPEVFTDAPFYQRPLGF